MGQVIIPDPQSISDEAPRLVDVAGLSEPQSISNCDQPLDSVDRHHELKDKATTPSITSIIVERDSIPLLPAPFSQPKTALSLTLKQHMETLVVKNALGKDEVEMLPEVLYDRTTTWRFVFNTFTEIPREQDQKISPYYRLVALREIKYPLGKRLGGYKRKRDGTMWGATLADFFKVKPWPDPSSPTMYNDTGIFVTSSMLYARFRSIVTNEEQYEQVRRIMRVAETEDRPSTVAVYSIERLIRDGEAWISSEYGCSWVQPTRPGALTEEKKREKWEVPESWPPKSIFDPSAYPSHWPLEPFKKHWWAPLEVHGGNFVHKPKLQQYIPESLLPKTLIVHDPWNLLGGYKCTEDRKMPWIEKEDVIRVYNLDESKDVRYRQDKAESASTEAREQTVRQIFLANAHSGMEMPDGMVYHPHQAASQEDFLGPVKPLVFVLFPPKLPKIAPSTAHLYLSPADALGEGHHSFVYRAELEIPRSMVVEDVICKECVCDDVKNILEEEDGPNGERRDQQWDQRSGSHVLKLRGKPPRKVLVESTVQFWDSGSQTTYWAYEGPYRPIQTRVGWQNLERAPYCEHLQKDGIHPLTSKVEVTAKLSKRYDDHLEKEGANYKAFPTDFFEHRTGFNLGTRVLKNPAPCGAVVPQFYGYYEPDWRDKRNINDRLSSYLSPILLLEECGTPIVAERLTADERNECISLVLRMNEAGWTQFSLYERNIVRQDGHLYEHPVVRRENRKQNRGLQSFRVIDFGRSGREKDLGYDEFEFGESSDIRKLDNWFRYDSLE